MEPLLESLIFWVVLVAFSFPSTIMHSWNGWGLVTGIVPACLSHYVTQIMIYLPSRYQHQVIHLHIQVDY